LKITVYTDYKSPYAYLANGPIFQLAQELSVTLDWKPYVLDIPKFLGSARVDAAGNVLEQDRNAHQWRRVRYSYMDCRRQARKQGLTIRGPQKIWDSSLAAAGMLSAQRSGETAFRHYHEAVFERFWRRELDIESVPAITAVLDEAGISGFADWVDQGRFEVAKIAAAAEAQGVFGVPTFIVNDELFWGREHLSDIRAMLT